jgi:4'-phosphopantetheinyl transferase
VTVLEASWQDGPSRPEFPDGEIHVWRIDLDGRLGDAEAVLTASERARVETFLRPEDALQFALSRAAVRRILGRYLDADPGGLEFARTRGGKPSVVAPGRSAPGYNLTHSHRLALCTVGPFELGIDVEWIRPAPMAAGIAAGIVSPAGPIRPDEIQSAERDWLFFRTWTRTEAALKATGEGLSAIDRRPATWIRELSQPGALAADGRPLRVYDLPVGLDYAAAVAVLGGAAIDVIRCWTLATPSAAVSGSRNG